MKVIKKNGSIENFNPDKIVAAISKSAERVSVEFTDNDLSTIISKIVEILDKKHIENVSVKDMHNAVETALHDAGFISVADSYKDYRNWKIEFAYILDDVLKKDKSIRFIGDKENSNTDSALVATKRSLVYGEVNKQFYKKFNLTPAERDAIKVGYIYIHDMSARRRYGERRAED